MIAAIHPRLDLNILGYRRVVDCADLPLEPVAALAPWKLLELPPVILRHPDLWFDGQWSEPR